METRPKKIYRVNFWKDSPEWAAQIALMAEPAEVVIAATESTFVSVQGETKTVTLSPGQGGSVNVQALPQNFKYAGMVTDLPFPMSLIPSTMATPMPKQSITPPFANSIGTIKEIASAASSFVGL